MGLITNRIIELLQEDGWKLQQSKDEPIIETYFYGRNGRCKCSTFVDEESRLFLFYSVCPVKPTENKRQAVSEFLTRANCGVAIGNFELDFTDGEISYKTSTKVEHDNLYLATIKHLIYTNVLMMDKYLPGIMAIIYGRLSPEQALADVEK